MSTTSAVIAQGLGFRFDSSADVALFDDCTFHLAPGFTGLVGANGCGKTTLLRVLRGELRPTSGQLRLEPRGARVAWCPQRVDSQEGLEAFAFANDRSARRWSARLRLDPAGFARWHTLSPGERKRWQVASALWAEPEVLLLDEPGNHLDLDGLACLRDALAEFRGVGVLVSHDRQLLDDVTLATLRLHQGTARLWPMGFTAAREAWTAEADGRRGAQRELQTKLKREAARLSEQRQTLRSSTRQRSAGARMKGAGDSDARSMGADARAASAEAQHAKALRRLERQAGAVRDSLEQVQVDDDAGGALFFRFESAPRPTVVQFRGLVPFVRSGGELSVQVRRSDHLWLRGPNGAGKTSLLNALLVSCDVPEDRRLVLPQELTVEDSRGDLETLRSLQAEVRGRVLQLVHVLGVEPERLLRTSSPSPGEARKLRLALGLGRHVWLAALDEPTNHLDVPSIERLEAALAAFPGALLLVTHDARLGEAVTHERLEL